MGYSISVRLSKAGMQDSENDTAEFQLQLSCVTLGNYFYAHSSYHILSICIENSTR